MKNLRFPCSGHDTVGGVVFFARMLDKIRLHAAGELPDDYNLGSGHDADHDTDACLDLALLGIPAFRTSLSPTGAGATPAAVREALLRYSTHAHGLDLDALVEAGHLAERIVGHPLPSAVLRGGSLQRFRPRAS